MPTNFAAIMSAVHSGFHANKRHWNTVYLSNCQFSPEFLFELIDHSYAMVVKNMPKKLRSQLKSTS